MLDWLYSRKKCPNHPENDAGIYCRICHNSFCSDCLKQVGDYMVCQSDSCRQQSALQISNEKESKSFNPKKSRKRSKKHYNEESDTRPAEEFLFDTAHAAITLGPSGCLLSPLFALFRWLFVYFIDSFRKKNKE
ncbi:MAG: hypothetical protein HQM10_17110 [Candidatus Riflebacteria bacterium]|nr:hypothetical protein [Candidatus Riflebacteria bacterium]